MNLRIARKVAAGYGRRQYTDEQLDAARERLKRLAWSVSTSDPEPRIRRFVRPFVLLVLEMAERGREEVRR